MKFNWLVFEVVAISGLLGMAIVLLVIFMGAYMNPLKQVLVDVDVIGEARWEVILLPTLVMMGVVALCRRASALANRM